MNASGPVVCIGLPLGGRLLVLSDLLLEPVATASSEALCADLADELALWEGQGSLVVAGNLFHESCASPQAMAEALAAHPKLASALSGFAAGRGRRVVVLAGWRDPEVHAGLENLKGVEVARSVLVEAETAAGPRRVEVHAGHPRGDLDAATLAELRGERPWLAGLDRLEHRTRARRFTTSRLLYRRLGRAIWAVPLLAVVAALGVRITWVASGLERVAPGDTGFIRRIEVARLESLSIAIVLAVLLVELLLALGVWAYSRRLFRAAKAPDPDPEAIHGGLLLDGVPAMDFAVGRLLEGTCGVVVGGALQAELAKLSGGFFATPGGTTELVREHQGHLGLPPVFLHHRQSSAIELEAGAELHVRLVVADVDLPLATLTERVVTGYAVVKGRKEAADLHPAMVASWPSGASWPPAPDISRERLRARRVRRITGWALFASGLVDVLLAASPPLRGRLEPVSAYLPLAASQTAGALVAVAGIVLMMLARGVLRGQRRPWVAAVAVLATTTALHLLHEVSLAGTASSALVLALLLAEQRYFRAATEPGSLATAFTTLGVGGAAAVLAATVGVELSKLSGSSPPAWPTVLLACAERLIGVDAVALPDRVDDFVYPIMFATGITLIVVALFQATRPVLSRRLSASAARTPERRAAETRARDIVARHGYGTLDYFALRDDKQWFFHRDSMVAYAVYGGMCLVSPDPIGPIGERDQVWAAFRAFADARGWGVAIMAAAEEWLPTYREAGMRHVYLGDEAVVDVGEFSLAGGKMKGLRQACTRIERAGYSVEVLDPNEVDRSRIPELAELLGLMRRGEAERGFSMMLGRLFDPRDRGLLLTIVTGPDGKPAAMCQFVPSPAIRGWSLDLMRRDPAEHPNGLLDFALCSTIEHLRARGDRGLSLNFSAMRSVLDGEGGDSLATRTERWVLQRLSGVLPIETLWRFNAKYRPSWLPRYICFDSAENLLPAVVQILRAEAITEIPVVGRFLRQDEERLSHSVIPAELLPELEADLGVGATGPARLVPPAPAGPTG